MTILYDYHRKARRKHICSGCQTPAIRPGDRYWVRVCNDGCDIYDWKACSECERKIEAQVKSVAGILEKYEEEE